jgi:hypothetical protein
VSRKPPSQDGDDDVDGVAEVHVVHRPVKQRTTEQKNTVSRTFTPLNADIAQKKIKNAKRHPIKGVLVILAVALFFGLPIQGKRPYLVVKDKVSEWLKKTSFDIPFVTKGVVGPSKSNFVLNGEERGLLEEFNEHGLIELEILRNETNSPDQGLNKDESITRMVFLEEKERSSRNRIELLLFKVTSARSDFVFLVSKCHQKGHAFHMISAKDFVFSHYQVDAPLSREVNQARKIIESEEHVHVFSFKDHLIVTDDNGSVLREEALSP